MPRAQFKLSTFVSIDPDSAFAFLSNLHNHKNLHGLLIAVKVLAEGKDDAGNPYKDYLLTDRMPFGPWAYLLRYKARVTLTGPREYTSRVHAAMGTKLNNVMRFEPEENGTRITEQVNIEAPALMLGFVRKQALEAHRKTFEGLPGVLKGK